MDDFHALIRDSRYKEYFTLNEIERFGTRNNKASLAARYLIKKILIERMGGALKPVDIEILNNEYGRPQICCHKISKDLQKKIHISVSHTGSMAMALVIIDH